jgi:hypothetical protein
VCLVRVPDGEEEAWLSHARLLAREASPFVFHAQSERLEERRLNGQPAIVLFRGEKPFAALLLAVADGKIRRVFFHADAERLDHLSVTSRAQGVRAGAEDGS